jgi:flagellar motor switch protein FliN/FliY
MAPKKAKTPAIEENLDLVDNSSELDQAIDDLRGVLKAADDTAAPDLDSDFGAEFGAGDTEAPALSFDGDLDSFKSEFGGPTDIGQDFGDFSQSASAPDFGTASEPGSGLQANLDLIMDIPIDVQIILGSSRMQVSTLMGLTEGATIPLDRKIGEPVDLIVNGRIIGRGEITVLENDETRFGIRLLEVKSSGRS